MGRYICFLVLLYEKGRIHFDFQFYELLYYFVDGKHGTTARKHGTEYMIRRYFGITSNKKHWFNLVIIREILKTKLCQQKSVRSDSAICANSKHIPKELMCALLLNGLCTRYEIWKDCCLFGGILWNGFKVLFLYIKKIVYIWQRLFSARIRWPLSERLPALSSPSSP